jgi:hypothetical protein
MNCFNNNAYHIKYAFNSFLKEDQKIIAYADTVASYVKIGPKANSLLYNSTGQKILFELFDDDSSGTSKNTSKNLANATKSNVGPLDFETNESSVSSIYMIRIIKYSIQ